MKREKADVDSPAAAGPGRIALSLDLYADWGSLLLLVGSCAFMFGLLGYFIGSIRGHEEGFRAGLELSDCRRPRSAPGTKEG